MYFSMFPMFSSPYSSDTKNDRPAEPAGSETDPSAEED